MPTAATVLGIETSCDETGVALVRAARHGDRYRFDIQADLLHSQVRRHRRTGGVVPEVAAREHAVRLPQLLQTLLRRYGRAALRRRVDAVAVTVGPGLVTSLLVGVEVARTITLAWGKPLVAVNHLEGHTYANLLPANARGRRPNGEGRGFVFPLLVLIVSGGHTELVLMRRHLTYRLVGATRDDAAGECFDKCARLLGLPYPGGPVLARLGRRGRPDAIPFPRPMQRDGTLDMSFAGLKTAVAVYLARHSGADRADVAASVEAAIVDVLVSKTLDAVTRYRPRAVALAGGVAANRSLRQTLRHSLAAQFPDVAVLEPALAYATDNAAMVAAAGAVRYLRGEAPGSPLVRVDPHLPLR